MEQILNELSFPCNYKDANAANQGIVNFIKTSIGLKKLGYKASILAPTDLGNMELAPNYTIHNWATDKKNSKEYRQYFLSISTCLSPPYSDEVFRDTSIEKNIDFYFQDKLAVGLGLGYINNSVTLSLGCHEEFTNIVVQLKKIACGPGIELSESFVDVLTFSSVKEVSRNRSRIRKTLIDKLNCGSDILDSAPKIFPHLEFCGNAEGQIKLLTGTEQYFPEIKRHFDIFEETLCNSSDADFRPGGMPFASRESETTMSNSKCKTARNFLCNDGVERFFWAHSKIQAYNIRIYVYFDSSRQRLLIGHVGGHLPLS